MLANFKKFGVAAAVAAALGASGAAQAITQGEPGDALLIPLVATNGAGSNLNTMISIISASPNTVNAKDFPTLTPEAKSKTSCNGTLHWYFFNKESEEIADNTFPVTCEDWAGIDWGAVVDDALRPIPSAKGVPGYMVITDNAADSVTASGKILYGTAYLIRGNWATQAYVPVVPLIDDVDSAKRDEVKHDGSSFLSEVNPVAAGMKLAEKETQTAHFSMRYYLYTTSPTGTTDFVLWFPDNSAKRAAQSILVYDADEKPVSATTSIPWELNILKVRNGAKILAGEIYTGVVADGLAPTGFVTFDVADYTEGFSTVNGYGSRAGVAFSLIGVNGSVAEQIQTELAHERGVK